MTRFVHVHTHSHYSLLEALPKIPELIGAAEACGMDTLALTDNGNLYGAIEFYKTCTKKNIKPIIGVDFYVAHRSRHDKEAGIDNRRLRMILIAENNIGYTNLIKLVTASHLEGFYYKPRIDHELMERHCEGLIAIIPAQQSDVVSALQSQNEDRAEELLLWYKNIFGETNVFFELTYHPEIDGHQGLMEDIKTLARKTHTSMIAAQEVFYLKEEDRQARETLLSVQASVGYRERGFTDREEDYSFTSPEEMEKRFSDVPEALESTRTLADRCNLELNLGEAIFPNFEIPKDSTYEQELRKLTYEGLAERGMKKTKEVEDRIEYELQIIADKKYSPYFLIVADLLRFARENEIFSNTRGSAAGSLVSYCCGITNIDPLAYRLPFERFLNPDRPSAPDIDMDFADDRRDEVIAYAREKYGEDNVAQIGTFGTMMARGAVRDTARALGYDYAIGDRIAKLIPFGQQGFPMTIDRALEEEAELKELYNTDTEARNTINMAKKIEGCARHISIHAAGVVISPVPLTSIVPLQRDPKGSEKVITQYDMYSVADEYGGVGLVKFDFLGLRNLAVLADAIGRVKHLLNVSVDVNNIPLDDEKTFAMLGAGRTIGVFQLAGSGMTNYLKQLKPTNVHDINAMVALYRPGPIEFIPEYIRRKHDPSTIDYPHESLKENLEQSLGLLIYQEDVMLTAIKLANYSWLEADKFRKAMGKKIPELMAEQEERFKSGCIENGIDPTFANELWRRITPFAAYAFNKAHASSYGNLAYQTAYMKANFPVIYMACLLTAEAGNIDRISEIIDECTRMSIEVLPPDINESFGDFTVVFDEEHLPQDVRFGLHSIKNFGVGIADAIIVERKKNGKFKSLEDFLTRVTDRNLNKKSLEALIKCGALDSFAERSVMLENLDDLITFGRQMRTRPENQDSLFGLMEDTSTVPKLSLRQAEEETPQERLAWEKELLGLYVSGHPLDLYSSKLANYDFDISRVKDELEPGTKTIVVGVIEEAKRIMTRGGERMAFVRLSDQTGSLEVVVFPRTYELYSELLELEKCVKVRGALSDRRGDISLLADAIKPL